MIQKETIRLYSRVALRLGMMWCLQALINDAFATTVKDEKLVALETTVEDILNLVTGKVGQLALGSTFIFAAARAGMAGNMGTAGACFGTGIAGVYGMNWIKTSLAALI